MITYTRTPKFIVVWLDKKRVGEIQLDLDGGYFYQPDGFSERGETFRTIPEVKRSLEDE